MVLLGSDTPERVPPLPKTSPACPPSPPLPTTFPCSPTLSASPPAPALAPPTAPTNEQTCASQMRTVPRMLSTAKIRTGSWTYYAHQVQHGACEYFLGVGEAPGRWHGRGLEPLGLSANAVVEERELEALFGRALHPVAHVQLGHAWRADGVTGYDLTFSAPKSVSALWALGDERIGGAVRRAHTAAARSALDYVDGHASYSRTGRDGTTQVSTDGLATAVFDHRTSRAGDPQLHTHALVLNKVRCAGGAWRTIDGHEIYAHKKSAGALYQAALRNELTRTLGVSWTAVSKDGQAEIAGVPTDLMRLWSKRTAQTLDEAAPVIDAYEQLLGRQLTSAERVAVEKVAVIKTRPNKETVDIVSLLDRWQDEAESLGWSSNRLTTAVRSASAPPPSRDQVLAAIDRTLADAVGAAGGRRAVFSRSDLAVEVAARLPARGFTADMSRELLERLTDRALGTSEAVRLRDATDGPTRTSDARFASRTTLNAELGILAVADTGRHDDVAVVSYDTLRDIVLDRGLDSAQIDAVASLCSDGAVISVLVAPAGTGKTTALSAAVDAWQHGLHTVVALGPSARAARELSAATGLRGDTVAKFLHEQGRQRNPRDPDWLRYHVGEGSVVIVDEASMLATTDLHALARLVWERRAKLVLVGDPAQIGAIDQAGGMLPALAHRLAAPSLDTVHRFSNGWERLASLQLREGNPEAIEHYVTNDRVHTASGDSDAVDALFQHYTRLAASGRRVLILARSNNDVDDLNSRARRHAIQTGDVRGRPLLTVGGRDWRTGDRLRVTRNDRRITMGADHLRNGDTFTVTGRTSRGLTVQRPDGTDTAELPTDYLAEHVRYGWASTVASAQGATVDDALLLARPGLDRNNLYVGLTRGRDSNHIYLAPEPEPEIAPASSRRRSVDVRQQLRTMIDNPGEQIAAHTQLADQAEPAMPGWGRRPTRDEQLGRLAGTVARRNALSYDQLIHDNQRQPDRGYGHER
jgi:conjugative relaxase-like TrwC/TraI family protein